MSKLIISFCVKVVEFITCDGCGGKEHPLFHIETTPKNVDKESIELAIRSFPSYYKKGKLGRKANSCGSCGFLYVIIDEEQYLYNKLEEKFVDIDELCRDNFSIIEEKCDSKEEKEERVEILDDSD